MKERIKGAFTKRKILHFLKMALFVVALSLILLSLLGTVAHATGLVDDTINEENLYSKYPLSNYQLDFYVDNSWSWLPWCRKPINLILLTIWQTVSERAYRPLQA